MSTNNPAQRSHSYPYRFPSLVTETHELNARWAVYVLQCEEKHAEAVANLERATKALDLRYGSPNPPTFNDRHSLERQQDEVSSLRMRIQRSREQLTYSLQIIAGTLEGMWEDMFTDLSNGELTEGKYCQYLGELAVVIETGTNHKLFETPKFQKMKSEIEKFITSKAA